MALVGAAWCPRPPAIRTLDGCERPAHHRSRGDRGESAGFVRAVKGEGQWLITVFMFPARRATARTRPDYFGGPISMMGRTSIEPPTRADGIREAIAIASSRFLASTM